MSEATDKIVKLVQKLMERTTDRGFTPAEEAAAAARVSKLLDEHNLSLFDVESRRFDETVTEERVPDARSALPTWVVSLSNYLADAYDCDVIVNRKREGGRWHNTLRFIGHTSDVRVARFMYETLAARLLDMADASGRAQGYRHAQLISYRSQFIIAAGSEIRQRIRESRTATATPTGTALVEVKSAAVAEWVKAHVPGVTFLRPSTARPNDDAREAGREAGRSIELTQGLETERRESLTRD